MQMDPVEFFVAGREHLRRVHGRICTSAAVYFSSSPSAATDPCKKRAKDRPLCLQLLADLALIAF
jgi:hypothetical protein